MPHRLLSLLVLLSLTTSCAFRRVERHKGIAYGYQARLGEDKTMRLNAFAPKRRGKQPAPVLIFLHGGDWNAGQRKLYNFLGNRLARKGVVAVIPSYPLADGTTYAEMAQAAAQAFRWAKAHAPELGGDSTRVFISGHSAGGHLAALLATDTAYRARPAGTILIDAAGLDMEHYLRTSGDRGSNDHYLRVFTQDRKAWADATPLYKLRPGLPPFLIFRGGKTYPSIATSNEKFIIALRPLQPEARYILQPGKHHVPMILQFFWSYNRRYKDMLRFMAEQR